MSRSPTSEQTALESTLKSRAVPWGPWWWRGRGHKNNSPPLTCLHSATCLFSWTQPSLSILPLFPSMSVSGMCTKIPSRRATNKFYDFTFFCNILWNNIKCCLFMHLFFWVYSWLWRQTKKLVGTLVEYSFHDRWVARSAVLTGTQLRFIFNSGSVCVCVYVRGVKLHIHIIKE